MKFFSSPFMIPVGIIAFSVVSLFSSTPPPEPPPEVIYVDASARRGHDGQSWRTPFRHLQDALRYAAEEAAVTEIRIAGGDYFAEQTTSRQTSYNTFAVGKPSLSIRGGYGGETRLGRRYGNGAVLSLGHISGHVSLSRLTLDGDLGHRHGVPIGLELRSGRITVDSCRFQDFRGQSPAYFAGARLEGARETVFSNCTFSNNRGYRGGGVVAVTGSATFTDCSFHNNVAETTGGGADILYHGLYTFDRCTFTDNTGGGQPSAIYRPENASLVVRTSACSVDGLAAAGPDLRVSTTR